MEIILTLFLNSGDWKSQKPLHSSILVFLLYLFNEISSLKEKAGMICPFCRSSSWELEAAAVATEQTVACWNILLQFFGYLPTWTIYRNREKISHQNILSFKIGSTLAPRDTNAPIHYARLQNWQMKQLRRQQQQNRLFLACWNILFN